MGLPSRPSLLLLPLLLPLAGTTAVGTPPALAAPAFAPLPLGSTRPRGWMQSQLRAQTSGLCGRKWLGAGGRVNDTKWLGGGGYDDLEEAYPYWLNGALPLAVLTEDNGALLNEIESQLDYVFGEAEKAGGWLGPNRNGSVWSSFRFCTAVTMYLDYAASVSDPTASATHLAARAADAMFDHAKALLRRMRDEPLSPGSWEHSRWEELIESYQWLLTSDYGREATEERKADVWELMRLAVQQGFDWPKWVESDEDHPFGTADGAAVRNWFPNNTRDADAIGSNAWMPAVNRQWTHGVNVGQAMQTWHLMYRLTSDATWLERGKSAWTKLMALHGQSNGVHTGDENLAGLPPNRGTETCAVVELMNSAGTAFSISGDVSYLESLERVAYNALPAAFFNGTMWSLNYFQQVNKLDAMDGQPDKCEGVGCTYCYGMVYECCVANHAQGWPKFVMRQLQASGADGAGRGSRLAITQYFASETTRPIVLPGGAGGGSTTTIGAVRITTDYPFSEIVKIDLEDASDAFVLELRIPGWCREATVALNGGMPHSLGEAKSGTMHPVSLPAGSHAIVLTLPMEVRVERRLPYVLGIGEVVATNAATVLRGPLVYALPLRHVHDRGQVFDDDDGDRPPGQSHGQNNYLLLTGEWRHALVVRDDTGAAVDLTHIRGEMPSTLDGQGPFAEGLVPDRIVGRAVLLSEEEWDVVRHGRGSVAECAAGTTSVDRYNASWAGLPPRSPVSAARRVPVTVELLPYGATDLRIAEFVTTTMEAVSE